MRQASEVELSLHPRREKVSLYEWLYAEIRLAILSGRLKPGERVPTSRDLARQHSLSRGTVVSVYDQLCAEGYLTATIGQGSFVSRILPDSLARAATDGPKLGSQAGRLSDQGRQFLASPFTSYNRANATLFWPHQPDYAAFPLNIWNGIVSKRSNAMRLSSMGYADPAGYLPLRHAIAAHLKRSQRIDCTADDVVIVGSTQQAIDLCGRLLLNPGDEAWIEEPGYPGAHHLLAMTGARIHPIPVDVNGLNTTLAMRIAPEARLAYVTAAHQSPMGVTMSLERRLALIRWAERAQATILEDDYDGEYRYYGAPLSALKSLDVDGRVVYIGTFSKLLFPSMRLAYLVLPQWLHEPFACALNLTCRHLSLHMQVALTEFIEKGHFARHLRRMRVVYQERAETFTEACETKLKGVLEVVPITSGLDATTLLPFHDDAQVGQRLLQEGIGARPISFYSINKNVQSGLLMGFSGATPDEIKRGIDRVATVLENCK